MCISLIVFVKMCVALTVQLPCPRRRGLEGRTESAQPCGVMSPFLKSAAEIPFAESREQLL